ncbi:MAG: efflux RND transporter permease subunit [Calditrichaceae bacterium]
MFLSSTSIKRPIMISMGLLVFFMFGLLAYFTLNLNMMPDVNIPYVTVQTIYPGAGPAELETLVSKKIEDAVSTVSKIEEINSYSMEGISYVVVEFDLSKDPDIANQEVKDKVSAIMMDLPEDAETPVVEKFDVSSFPVMEIVFSGNLDIRELYDLADKKLKDRFSQIEGVGRVNLIGGQEREIRVELDDRIVYQNKISLMQLAQILNVQNMDVPGGRFQQKDQEFSVRFKGQFSSVDEINNLEVPTAFGVKRLGQLADISDAGAEVRQRSIYFNKVENLRDDNVVTLSIIKSVDGNTVVMADAVKEEIPLLEKELPTGTSLTIVRDQSLFIQSSVNDTLSNIILGVVLTGFVLLFFLHDLRSTIIVGTAMPFSIISTFLFIQLSGFSLNIMTLMGLSTAVGILVTNSVVVLENIFRHKEMGHSRSEAADKGTSEIAVAVIASTLTNIAVFLPIASMSSMVGQFFKQFALTVTYSTVFSIIASFTITPMLASLILPEHDTKKHPIGKKLEHMFHAWETKYLNWLKVILANKLRSFWLLVGALIFFVLSMVFLGPFIGFEFMPMLDEGDILIEVELPQGYNLNETADLLSEIEKRVSKHKEVSHMLTNIGYLDQLTTGANMAVANVKLIDVDKRELSSAEMADVFIKDLSTLPNAKIRVSAVSAAGRGGEAPIQLSLLGQDIEKLEIYKLQLMDSIKNIPGLINLSTSSRPGKPEITLVPNRVKIANVGLTVYDLAMALRGSVEGVVAGKYREAGNEYDIRLKLTEESVDTPEEIGNIAVMSPNGVYRISQLADVSFTSGYSTIMHTDKYKSIEINGYNAPGVALGNITSVIDEKVAELDFDPGYRAEWKGSAKMMQETIVDMLRTFIIAFLLTYMLLAAILESLTQPLMILATVPLALIGVVASLVFTGVTMNMISMMAIVMLLGLVVNNAILQMDYANQLRRQGKTIKDALLEACPTKLKPIIMATVAIVLGMMPMALGIGSSGVEFRQPMGLVSIGGMIISTALGLFVIPAFYYLFSKSKTVKING